jgi:uncharacterized protein
MHLSSKVTEGLGHYVYLYVDPRDEVIFYVGKGSGSRCLTHLSDGDDTEKVKRIAAIRDSGLEPRIDVLVHGLPNSKAALQVEAAVIDLVGRAHLTNRLRGWKSEAFGRMDLKRLISLYDSKRVHIKEPSLLIRINQLFRFGMTPIELYDATRGIWKIGPDRDQIRLAFAVFRGIVREVYRVSQWMPAGSSFSTRMTEEDDLQDPERWEFVGVLAEDEVRKKYVNGSVVHYFGRNVQSPFVYVKVKRSRAGTE